MLKNQYNPQHLPPNTSWIISDFKEKERQRVVRKFINSAIYVEKEITEMPLRRKTSPLCATNEDPSNSGLLKKCSCTSICSCGSLGKINSSELLFTNKGSLRHCCSSNALQSVGSNGEGNGIFNHENLDKPAFAHKTPESGYRTMEQSSNSSNEHSENSFTSGITVKAASNSKRIGSLNNELRLSLTCLNTNRTCTLDPKERQEIVQNWITKKELEMKRKALQETKIAKQKEEERQRLIKKERENFKKWLTEKKQAEEKRRAQKEVEAEKQKLKAAQKQKKQVENDINFNLWLRRKKTNDLEKRITEKIALLHMYEDKQKRMEENEKAYQDWLESSKNRQKPVPMNQGIQSLCSSASVTYINPIPWTPNIDPNIKPLSQ